MSEDIYLPDGRLAARGDELRFSFVRSSGPGGQNVNKTATKAELRWSLAESSLPDEVRRRLLASFRSRVNAAGELVIVSQRYRSQDRNQQDCLQKLGEMLAAAATPPKRRKPTRPTRASVERRLTDKRRTSERKARRQPPGTS